MKSEPRKQIRSSGNLSRKLATTRNAEEREMLIRSLSDIAFQRQIAEYAGLCVSYEYLQKTGKSPFPECRRCVGFSSQCSHYRTKR